MKTGGMKKHLTLGEFIERVYDAYGKRRAAGVVRLALKAHMIELLHR
jgi:hypothetical protein